MKFLLRWLATALAVAVAVWLIPGLSLNSEAMSAVIAVAVFGLILTLLNMSVKPLLQLIAIPITIVTLGIFYLIINAAMLYLAAWIVNGLFNVGFTIAGFGSALLGSIIISLVFALVSAVTGANKDEK